MQGILCSISAAKEKLGNALGKPLVSKLLIDVHV